jgi:hypothetical protein
MRKGSCRWVHTSLLLLALASAVCADTPLIGGQVVRDNGVTRYIYTLTNNLSSGWIYGLYHMTLPDGRLEISHGEPSGWIFWYPKFPGTPEIFSWSTEQSMLQPGQFAVFEIQTSSPVTTQWVSKWNVAVRPVQGRDYDYSDGTALPVPAPVPEPSSILALAGGIAGLGGFVLRRKRS